MAEYIDREKTIEIIEQNMTKVVQVGTVGAITTETYNMAKDHAIDYLKCVPTEDVVPVVRCENCKHCRKDAYFNYCDKYSRPFDKFYVEKDHFCSYGERKDENE